MRTRSQARRRRQPQVRQPSVESPNLEKPNNNQETFNPPIVTMDDNRTMAQLLEAPTEGYEDAIVVPKITVNNFAIVVPKITVNKITSTMKFPNVPSTSVKLMLFPFSLEGAARIWLEKEPPRSILTWDDLVSKFINKFFPPSKTTNLRNEITRFQQKFDETFYEAWDRFNDLLRGCPHHGFSELHQLDTFYNALNSNDQDSLNSAAGGNFLDKIPRECLKIIESKSKVRQSRSKAVVARVSTSSSTPAVSSDVAELKDMVRALILDRKNQTPASAPIKRLNNVDETMQNQGQIPAVPNANLTDMLSKFVTANTVLLPVLETLSGTENVQPPVVQIQSRNPNPEPVVAPVVTPIPKALIPFPSRRNDERRKEKATTQIEKFFEIFRDLSLRFASRCLDAHAKFASTLKKTLLETRKFERIGKNPLNEKLFKRSSQQVTKENLETLPILIPCEFRDYLHATHWRSWLRALISCLILYGTIYIFLNWTPTYMTLELADTPGVPLIHRAMFLENSVNALIDVMKVIEFTLRVGKEAITFNLWIQTSTIQADYNHYDVNHHPLPNQEQYLPGVKKELKLCEAKTVESSVDEPPEVELKELPPHLEYAFLEGDDKLPVIIAKDLKDEEKAALLKVLKSHKRAIAWKLSDIKGVNPEFCTHKILMEEDYEPSVQSQRRVNPKIHDVNQGKSEKLSDAGLIYPILSALG
ncbi:reverse transcriptase domain-containing protein [Tanacetum coccineum]